MNCEISANPFCYTILLKFRSWWHFSENLDYQISTFLVWPKMFSPLKMIWSTLTSSTICVCAWRYRMKLRPQWSVMKCLSSKGLSSSTQMKYEEKINCFLSTLKWISQKWESCLVRLESSSPLTNFQQLRNICKVEVWITTTEQSSLNMK